MILLLAILAAGCSKGNPAPAGHQGGGNQPPTQVPSVLPASAAGGPLTGTWNGTWTSTSTPGYGGQVHIQFTQSGAQLSGSIDVTDTPCVTHGTITGTLEGSRIAFGAVQAQQTVAYTGSVQGNTISGTYAAPMCGNGVGKWQVTRSG